MIGIPTVTDRLRVDRVGLLVIGIAGRLWPLARSRSRNRRSIRLYFI
jgi:hypothetical protein